MQVMYDLDPSVTDLNTTGTLAAVAVSPMATYLGISIFVSSLMPDGQAALFDGDTLVGMVSLENTPAKPLDPMLRVARITMMPGMLGVWGAYDEDGEFLWHLTEEGAKKLAALKGLDF